MHVQTLGGGTLRQKWGPKTSKILVDFIQPPTLITNIFATTQDIQNWKAKVSKSFPPSSWINLYLAWVFSTKMSSGGELIMAGYSCNFISGNCFNISMIQCAIFHVKRFHKSPKIRLLIVTMDSEKHVQSF